MYQSGLRSHGVSLTVSIRVHTVGEQQRKWFCARGHGGLARSACSVLRKCYWEVGKRVNYCNGDLHRTEREASVANQKTGNVSKNALNHGPECILNLNQLLCSGLKLFNSLL